jgi:DNA-binding response OmpR family regulator
VFIKRALDSGVDKVVPKPMEIDEVRNIIARLT